MQKKFEAHYPLLFSAITAFLIYLPIVFFPSPVNPDSQVLIPNLREFTSVSSYIANFVMLRTLDIQPIRDLSLYLDLWILDTTGFNSFVLQNILIWLSSIAVLNRLLIFFFPKLSIKERAFILVAFTAYPLFTQTISWGVARKHLLAMFFSLLATEKWIKQRRSTWLFYVLAVLSQPIFILWPLWAFIHGYFVDKSLLQNRWGVLLTCTLLLFLLGHANYFYYEHSPVFLTHYAVKTNEIFEVSNKSLALGHYTFQLLFPYLLSFDYSLGHWSTLVGLLILGIGVPIVLRNRENRSLKISLLCFTFLPLAVVLTKPTMIYDTYLLLPASGLLMLIVLLSDQAPVFKYSHHFMKALLIFWCCFSLKDVFGWRSEILLTKNSFNNRPSCISAFQYLRMSYENGVPPIESDAKLYFAEHECYKDKSVGSGFINLQASMLYYETDLTPEERITRLEVLAPNGVFPSMALAALYLKYGKKEEANAAIGSMLENYGKKEYKEEAIPIARQVLEPYCRSIQHKNCVAFLRPFLIKK